MVTIDSCDRFSDGSIIEPHMAIGQVFGDSFRVMRQAWLPVFGIAVLIAIIGIPIALMQAGYQEAVIASFPRPPRPEVVEQFKSVRRIAGALVVLDMLFIVYAFAAVADGAKRVLEGEDFNFGKALNTGLRRFLPMLGSSILLYLMLVVATVVFILPVFWIGSIFGLAPTLTVIERCGPFSSLSRSRMLTYRNRWRCLGATAVHIIVLLLVVAIQFFVMYRLGYGAYIAASAVANIVTLPLTMLVTTVMAVQLKGLKDSGGAQNVAQVF